MTLKTSLNFWIYQKQLDRAKSRKEVNVDFAIWMIHSLDKEAKQLGVTRESIIKIWIADRLNELHA